LLADEAAFWSDEDGKNPTSEIFNALAYNSLTLPDALTIIGTTPMGKRNYIGELFDSVHGDNANMHTLCWQAASLVMNPTLDRAEIALAFKLDPVKAAAELGAEFRSEFDALITHEALDRNTPKGVYERMYDDTHYYIAALDAASGSGKDSMTLAICHRDGDVAVLDLVREVKPPFSPDAVAVEFSEVMHRYSVSTAWADNWALGYVDENFKRNGVTIEHPEKLDRSAIYSSFVALLNSDRATMLDHMGLRRQLLGLTRYASRVKEIIDHKSGAHDDIATSACLACVKCVFELTAMDYWRWQETPAGRANIEQQTLDRTLQTGGVIFPTAVPWHNRAAVPKPPEPVLLPRDPVREAKEDAAWERCVGDAAQIGQPVSPGAWNLRRQQIAARA